MFRGDVALEAVLKANRLGIEVNGNILRVATTEVLAKEAETQKIINDSRLDASPLVTEFIRLNYARASGTLAQAAGSTGAFSGGATNLSFGGGAGGDATGGSGDQVYFQLFLAGFHAEAQSRSTAVATP